MQARVSLTLAASLALAACGAVIEPSEAAPGEHSVATVATVSAGELARLVEDGSVILVDVRTPEEFATMRIAGGLNAPVQTFAPDMIPQEAGRETILYCRSDRRSGIAAEQLATHVEGRVRHLEGGILAWQEAGLPVEAQPPS